MSEKVILPKEVAEALGFAKDVFSRYDIIESLRNSRGINNEHLRTLRDWCGDDETTEREDTIITAIVNGYAVEQTPEEAVRAYYESAKIEAENAGQYEGDYYRGEVDAIEETISLLGVKIEGINA